MIRVILILSTLAISPSRMWAEIKCQGLVNSASFRSDSPPNLTDQVFRGNLYHGVPSGGSLATLFCSGVAGQPGIYIAPSLTPLPFVLAGVRISVNAASAPILAVVIPPDQTAYAQINFQMPLERNSSSTRGPTGAVVENPIQFVVGSAEQSFMFTETGMRGIGGFFSDGAGYAIAIHTSDRSLVNPQNPAHPGETLIVYANDFFAVWPHPPIGVPAPQQLIYERSFGGTTSNFRFGNNFLYLQDYPPYIERLLPSSSFGSFATTPSLNIISERLAPGMVGVEEITFVVPPNQAPGDWPLFFNEGSCPNGGSLSSCGIPKSEGISSAYVKLSVR